MKANQSLARFSGLIGALAGLGLLLTFVGILMVAMNSGYSMNMTAIINGVVFLYIGGGLIGLAIFGAFLRITATSIIEGLGGNVNIFASRQPQQMQRGPVLTGPLSTPETKTSTRSGAYNEDEEFLSLSFEERHAWVTSGGPDLEVLVAEGRPDFLTWVKNNTKR